MKRKVLTATLSVLLAGLWATGARADFEPGTGIQNTFHDFSFKTAGDSITGLCTFCHTPHRAIQTRLLWNHTLSQNTFTWQDATHTTGGTELPVIDPSWTGPTKFCLSCHDGSVAIGDVAWFNKKTWVGNPIDGTTHDNDDVTIGAGGDMSGNHPVAHPFPLNGTPSTYNDVTTGDEALLSGWVPDPSVNGIRLFHQVGGGLVVAGGQTGNTGIECSSCHDPHNGPTVQDKFFLRGALGGHGPDYICVKCHDK